MKKSQWRAVVTALEYTVQFWSVAMLDSEDGRRELFNLVWYRRVYPFSPDDTRRALRFLEGRPDIDISGLLPQPHSDKTLRRVFSRLYRTLDKLPV
ncbi:hypothetical protein [Duganella radicis]|uniref:Uncharacterized protein n=1 Tax=Duganella radicis TaxID=551988 RepID=A0A6L6PKD8_9BURK|nr:hypothetical protein [Duganella radicis]MTV39423.1 hypothetical protein [Duganella radicis]